MFKMHETLSMMPSITVFLGAITDGRISITIDSAKRFIEIRDNGIGIPVERVESVLLDIADSNKDGESSAGQFGIGRLVGGYFCKKLSFRTTYKGRRVCFGNCFRY